jgi:hypothetical protein
VVIRRADPPSLAVALALATASACAGDEPAAPLAL